MKLKNLLPFFLSFSLCFLKGTNTLNSDEKELRLLDSSTDEVSKLKSRAKVYFNQKMYTEALVCYDEILKIKNKRVIDAKLERVTTLKHIGDISQAEKKYDEAIVYYKQAMTVHELRPKKNLAYAELCYSMGATYYEIDDYENAIQYYEDALEVYEIFGMKKDQGYTLHNLGMCYNSCEDYNKALVYYKKALKIRQELDKKSKEYSETLEEIIVIHEECWEHDQAIIHCKEMLNFLEKKQGKDSQKYLTTLNKIHYLHEMKNKSLCDLLYGVWVRCWQCCCC